VEVCSLLEELQNALFALDAAKQFLTVSFGLFHNNRYNASQTSQKHLTNISNTPQYKKPTVPITSIQLTKTLPPAIHSGTWASKLNTYQFRTTWIPCQRSKFRLMSQQEFYK
jgi:hypothetical protein